MSDRVEPIDEARGLYTVPRAWPLASVWNVTRRFSVTEFLSGGSHDTPEQQWCRGLDRDNANAPVVILRIYDYRLRRLENAMSILREVAILRRLHHPNIVKIVDVLKTEPNDLYVVYQDGGMGLDAWLRQNPRPHMSADTVRCMMQQLVAAVGYLHRCSIVHNDIKPSSILIHPVTLKLTIANFGQWRVPVVAGMEQQAAAARVLPCSDCFDDMHFPESDEETEEDDFPPCRQSDAVVMPHLCAPCSAIALTPSCFSHGVQLPSARVPPSCQWCQWGQQPRRRRLQHWLRLWRTAALPYSRRHSPLLPRYIWLCTECPTLFPSL